MPENKALSRRTFLERAAGVTGAVAVGIFAFPPGTELIEAAGAGAKRITRSYQRERVAGVGDLGEGEPFEFSYPLEDHENFVVKLGADAHDGVGPDGDIVAYNYLCSHMGCPLNGKYRHDHKIMGPCPCHFSTFDLSKNGVMVLGQATQSLPQIVLEVDGSDVFAVGVTGLVYGYRDNLDSGTLVGTS